MDHQEYVKPHHGGYVRYTALAFCFDAKKQERGRAWPRRQSGEIRIVSKLNDSPVQNILRSELRVQLTVLETTFMLQKSCLHCSHCTAICFSNTFMFVPTETRLERCNTYRKTYGRSLQILNSECLYQKVFHFMHILCKPYHQYRPQTVGAAVDHRRCKNISVSSNVRFAN